MPSALNQSDFTVDRQQKTAASEEVTVTILGGQGIEPWTHGLRVRCSAS